MKKITLLLLVLFFSITGYSQLALEGFESTTGPDALPSTNWTLGTGNWAVFDNGVGTGQRWGINTVNICSGTQIAYINREFIGQGSTSQDYLATPLVTVPTNGELHFLTKSFTSGNQGTIYQIKVAPATASQTNPAAYTLVQQWTETELTAIYNVCEEKIVSLSAFAGQQVYVSFVMIFTQPTASLGGDRWLVDNVSINQQCSVITGLTATGVTSNGASLNWANPSGATSWEIEIIPAANTPTGVGVVYNGTLPYLVTGLLPNTAYKYYVRGLCNTGYSSIWSAASPTFSTTAAPPICGGNFVDSGATAAAYANNENITTIICPTVTGDKVTITFTAFNTEANYDGLYVYNGNAVVPANLFASANPAGNVPGALAGSYWGNLAANLPGPFTSTSPDGCLTFVFRSDGSVTNPGWIANITCAPPPTCQQPITLTTANITTTSVTVGWSSPGTASSWQVIALPAGSLAPTAATTGWTVATTNPFVLTGLTPGTAYEYYVRGDCGAVNGVSLWSGPRAFSTVPTCPAPTVLTTSSVLATSVQLNWTSFAPSASWQVLALPCGSPTPGAGTTGWVAVTTNPYVLTGLTPTTCYDFYVRGVCSPTDISFWSASASATTQALPPVCGGNYVDAAGPTANYVNNSDSTVTICPTIAGQQVTVTFTNFNTEANWDALYVFDGSTIGAPQIASANPAANVPGGLAGGFWGATIPGPFTSSSPDGCLTFRFRSDGSVTLAGWIANVTCNPPPTCQQPTALTTSALTFNSVTLGWTNVGVATSWQVLVLPCNSPAPTDISTGWVVATTNPFVVSGLTSATCYNLYVRGNCASTSNGVSLWSGPRIITTLVAPPICGGNFVDAAGPTTNYANNSNVTTTICPTTPGEIVTVTFTSFGTEANWDGLYVYDGNTVNPAAQIASTNPAANVPGGLSGSYWGNTIPGPFTSTTSDGCLTFVFRSDGSVTLPGWIANITCSPAPTCARPILVTATNVTQTSALLSWDQPLNPDGSQATAWEILILPAGSPIPTTNGIPATSPYLANGLSAGTAYVFYVRAICSSTDTSVWSVLNFAALPVNDECANATFAIVNQNLNCVQTTPGTLSGATGSLPTTTCPGVINDDVWFTFTATAVTHIISFNNVVPATALNYAIFQGTDCGALTQIGCNSGANLIPGTTYYVRVYSDTAVPQFTNFNLCIGTLPCVEAPAFCTGQTVTYANSTNIPSLGQIGCLGTSPNSAFFFLQVNQAGPLSYLISQITTAGAPIDVDYVAWGPFSDLTTACSGVPANPLPSSVPFATVATGCLGTLHACSYSTAAQEIMCIPNAQLCQVYVIMITNFANQAGTVTFTQTNSGGGTTECFPINTFNYPGTYYCQNGTNPTPVLAPGASAGIYTSTAGLVIDSVTGTIDLAASTPGPYIVTSTTLTSTSGTCTNIPSIITTRTIIITAAANATISYPSATYCNNITSSQAVTQTGTTTGNYSSSPSGLLINQNTGEILPIASTPGIYTVTYSIPAVGGCPAFVTSTPVEILATPIVAQQAPVSVCNSYILPALTIGNYFDASGGTGNQLNAGDVITTTQTIYVFAQNSNCTDEKSFIVTINFVPTPTFTVTQPTCQVQTGTVEVTSPISAPTNNPSNLFISEVTDENTGSLTYIEIFNGTGADIDLGNYKLKIYNNGNTASSCDLVLSGIIVNNSTNIIKVSSDANQGGIVPNQVFASCGGVNNNDNIRLTTSADVEIDLWGRTDGVSFTPSNQPGYTYRRNTSATFPSLTWNASDWTAIDPQDYSNVGSYSLQNINFEYNIDGGAYQIATTFTTLTPGTHTVIVHDLFTGCYSQPTDVIINAVPLNPTVTVFSYATPVCQDATTNPVPNTSTSGFTTGGAFTSTAGLTIDSVSGLINLAASTAGTYTVTYSVNANPSICLEAGSSVFDITINPVITPVTTFNYTTPVCAGSSNPEPNVGPGFTSGGTFSSTAGLSINSSTGEISLSTTIPGTYTITYSIAADAATCQLASTHSSPIVISNPVEVSVSGECVGVNYILTASPVGTSFDPNAVSYSWEDSTGLSFGTTQSITVTSEETYTVTVVLPNGCSGAANSVVAAIACVIQKGISPNNDSLNDTFNLTGWNVKNLGIYNRYGTKVYSQNNYTNQWGGQTDKGEELPDGTYYFVIERDSGETRTGWIYINREI